MKTYEKQWKPTARTLSARAGHGRQDVAGVLQAYRNRTAQLASLTDEDNQTLQGKFVTQLQGGTEENSLQQKTENRTGLPDRLKAGVENLSGYSLDGVKVHYNSSRPAQLQALAYTQGTDIHIGPGQERYLGHEAWHVVQQMQGRVQPTMQLQGLAVNDNEDLEREADVMGEKAQKNTEQAKEMERIANGKAIMPLQLAWDVTGVNDYLRQDQIGIQSIQDLNSQNYTVNKIKDIIITRTYTDGRVPKTEQYVIKGYHQRGNREIAISDESNDNGSASSTIVHEVAHANQHQANEKEFFFWRWLNWVPFPDVLSKEVDAHKKQELYNQRMGLNLNAALWEGDKLNDKKIEEYIKRVYLGNGVSGKRPFIDKESSTIKVGSSIKPWPVPTE